jgi:hypothetical protein
MTLISKIYVVYGWVIYFWEVSSLYISVLIKAKYHKTMFTTPTVHVPVFEQACLMVFKHEEFKDTTEEGVDRSIRI